MSGKLVICCVQHGNYCNRGAEYVNILYDMVRRNLPAGYEGKFVCFTDDPSGLHEAIEATPLPQNLNGWWNKLWLFAPGHFDPEDLILYLDLDTIISGALDDIIEYKGNFAMLSDFYHPHNIAGGVIMWRGDHSHIWNKWIEAGKPEDNGSPETGFGEANWIQKIGVKADLLQDIFPKQIVSYKVSAKFEPPGNARIVCFHGIPRPHECDGWVKDFWKIGGAAIFYSKAVGNTDDAILARNIRHAISLNTDRLRPVKPHKTPAIIIGGGPSLKNHLDEICQHKIEGQVIFATNNSYGYLIKNSIKPDHHVMLDARPEMATMVPYLANCYYASQCAPEVFKSAKANGSHVILWHHFAEGIQNIIPKGTGHHPMVGMGSSSGLKAIAIAHILGFREFHLYGFDSCYADGDHHAYEQALNNGEKILDIVMNGKNYHAAPWMCTQIEEFKEIIPHLTKDSIVTAHGEGLLQDICVIISNSLENNV